MPKFLFLLFFRQIFQELRCFIVHVSKEHVFEHKDFVNYFGKRKNQKVLYVF